MQEIINRGSRSVSIFGNTEEGPFTASVFNSCTGPRAVDLGDHAGISKRFKRLANARKWAVEFLTPRNV